MSSKSKSKVAKPVVIESQETGEEIKITELEISPDVKDPRTIDTAIQQKKLNLKRQKELAKIAKEEKAIANLEKDLKLVDIIDEKLEIILEYLTPDVIEKAKLKELVIAAGILIDKRKEILEVPQDEEESKEKKKPVKLRVLWGNEGGGVEIIEGG